MVILGLGTNQGDRLRNLRRTFEHLKKIPNLAIKKISPLYVSDALLPHDAPPSWNKPYFNLCISVETTLSPDELLKQTKHIEKITGRKEEKDWGPRIIDIDILAWDQKIIINEHLHIPHEHLHDRPFALKPFSDIAPFWMYPMKGSFEGKTAIEMVKQWGENLPLHTKQIPHRIDIPELVGIVNITPDSFSDGGTFREDLPLHLTTQGADIIDFGAEATGPKATPLDSNQEWARLSPVLEKFIHEKKDLLTTPKISIDTYHPETAKKALQYHVDWINDVSGFDNAAMREVAAENTCDIVFMHHVGIPVSTSSLIPLHEDPVQHVYQWAEMRMDLLLKSGIPKERLIFDVGIGYGKTAEQSLALIQEISAFKKLGCRLLVGHSRKSFLTLFTNKPARERDLETGVISLYLANQGIDYIRLHNIEDHMRLFSLSSQVEISPHPSRSSLHQ